MWLKLAKWVAWRHMWAWCATFGWLFYRYSATGQKAFPKKGPVLLLPNHTSTMDPMWVAFFCWRRVNFMASAQLFRFPLLARFISFWGAFPKQKYVRDEGALDHLNKLWDDGEVVLIFPEGKRTWDGRNHQVLPGIGRLIQRLGATVVYARIKTGHLNHPRWATFPRWVPVELEYDGPHTYEGWETDAIVDDVNRRIRIDHRVSASGWTLGYKMAHGLSDYLWACPSCFATAALDVHPDDGNSIQCGACRASWRLDTSNRMHRLDAQAEPLLVPDALDRVLAHFGEPPVVDRERFDREGVVMDVAAGGIGRVVRGADPEPIADGRVTLTADRLAVLGPDGRELWGVALVDIKTMSFELLNVFQLRTRSDEGLLQLTPGDESTPMWGHFIWVWRDIALSSKD